MTQIKFLSSKLIFSLNFSISSCEVDLFASNDRNILQIVVEHCRACDFK